MWESINNFMLQNALFFKVLVPIIISICLYQIQSVRFWVTDFLVSVKWVGKIARWSKDEAQGAPGWTAAEESLCATYKPFVSFLTQKQFNNNIEYIKAAGDLGNKPTPAWVWFLLFPLVVAEGLGFSFLLASWMAREGSANTLNLLMFAIVFVIAIVLVAIMHQAGHQLHRTLLLRAQYKEYKGNSSAYSDSSVALNDNQDDDKDKPNHTRCVNRVAKNPRDKGSFFVVYLAIVSIAIIAITSTVMRYENLQADHARSASVQESASGNPFDNTELPSEVMEPQQAADAKARSDINSNENTEGMFAFIMLGFIFVITQFVGIGAGYKYGFVGKESAEAYKSTFGFSTYDAYRKSMTPLVDLINRRLKDLQQKLKDLHANTNPLNKKFLDYIAEQIKVDEVAEETINQTSTSSAKSVAASSSPLPSEVDVAKAEILKRDEVAQKEYYLTLSPQTQDALKPWLKQRKEEKLAKIQQEELLKQQQAKADVEDLF
ncbi:MAG: hypothetical protein ACTS9Y_03355 [Methylophilus sp.]|uniref:hypothetical protein n=1 Tax=Methylophilus sp. TaxID=29541 RepID=UPI003FA0750D